MTVVDTDRSMLGCEYMTVVDTDGAWLGYKYMTAVDTDGAFRGYKYMTIGRHWLVMAELPVHDYG